MLKDEIEKKNQLKKFAKLKKTTIRRMKIYFDIYEKKNWWMTKSWKKIQS